MGRRRWAVALWLAAGVAPAVGQPLPPPAGPVMPAVPPPADSGPPPPADEPRSKRVSILGDPQSLRDDTPAAPRRGDMPPADDAPPTVHDVPRSVVAPASHEVSTVNSPAVRAVSLELPAGDGKPVSAAKLEAAVSRRATTTPSRTADDPVGGFLTRRSTEREDERDDRDDRREGKNTKRGTWKFGDRLRDAADGITGGPGRDRFRSDHAFDGYVSPVTNPFLFEDPRSLTEIRPLVIFQRVPGGQPDYHGGTITYFGTQARVAITERFSFVLNKLGGVVDRPGDGSVFSRNTGFAEVWLAPKYTFIRDEQSGTLMSGQLQFQIPVGSSNVVQHTGALSLVPNLSVAHPFFRDGWFGERVGTVNTMLGTGYSFSTNRIRSDYYYLSAHADLNVCNWNRVYPLAELNWQYTTTNGQYLPVGTEGRDLFNLGGQARNTGLLTGAFGARVKVTESAQIGAAYEIPFAGRRDLFSQRFTLDFILRY